MSKYVVFEGKKTVEIEASCIAEYEEKVGAFTENTVNYLIATLGLSEEQTESVLSEEIMKAMKEDCEDSAKVKELLKNHMRMFEYMKPGVMKQLEPTRQKFVAKLITREVQQLAKDKGITENEAYYLLSKGLYGGDRNI